MLSFRSMNHKLSQDFDYDEATQRSSPVDRRVGWSARIIGLAVILVLIRPTDASAYIDPSTGGYLLQMLLAGILAAAFTIRMFWRNLKLFFQKKLSGSDPDETDSKKPTR